MFEVTRERCDSVWVRVPLSRAERCAALIKNPSLKADFIKRRDVSRPSIRKTPHEAPLFMLKTHFFRRMQPAPCVEIPQFPVLN
jgi:hypothetical protein